MKITLCSSRKFFNRLYELKEKLEKCGHEVLLPSMKDFEDNTIEEDTFRKIHNNLIKEHFKKIDKSNAILVANFDKNNIKNYIGGNVFLEMGKAFDKGIPIFLLNEVPTELSYTAEIKAMLPIELNGNLSKINEPKIR